MQGDFRREDMPGPLSTRAAEVLKQVDKMCDYLWMRGMWQRKIRIAKGDYEALNAGIKRASYGEFSLQTHTYRGFEILRH